MSGPLYTDLADVLPNVHPDCTNAGFHACERDVLTPALEKAGWVLAGNWYTGDGDSFGPLTRCIRAHNPQGVLQIIVYG